MISVDDIREQVNNDIIIKPYSSRYKIYIIPEAELMNPQAQNALLKTIEEPPEYAVIMLLTNNLDKMLPTILSRCITLNLKPVGELDMMEYLSRMGVPQAKASSVSDLHSAIWGRPFDWLPRRSIMRSSMIVCRS